MHRAQPLRVDAFPLRGVDDGDATVVVHRPEAVVEGPVVRAAEGERVADVVVPVRAHRDDVRGLCLVEGPAPEPEVAGRASMLVLRDDDVPKSSIANAQRPLGQLHEGALDVEPEGAIERLPHLRRHLLHLRPVAVVRVEQVERIGVLPQFERVVEKRAHADAAEALAQRSRELRREGGIRDPPLERGYRAGLLGVGDGEGRTARIVERPDRAAATGGRAEEEERLPHDALLRAKARAGEERVECAREALVQHHARGVDGAALDGVDDHQEECGLVDEARLRLDA